MHSDKQLGMERLAVAYLGLSQLQDLLNGRIEFLLPNGPIILRGASFDSLSQRLGLLLEHQSFIPVPPGGMIVQIELETRTREEAADERFQHAVKDLQETADKFSKAWKNVMTAINALQDRVDKMETQLGNMFEVRVVESSNQSKKPPKEKHSR